MLDFLKASNGHMKECKLSMETLSRQELLSLLCVLEGELQARDQALQALRAQRRDLYIQERYGKYSLSDPFLALQRDGEAVGARRPGGPGAVTSTSPLVVLRLVVGHCRSMQEKMLLQLAAAETRHRRVIADLEEERCRHAEDTAEGDDVTYILEKERERLLQQLEFERGQVRRLEKQQRRQQEEERSRQQLSRALASRLEQEQQEVQGLRARLEEEKRRALRMEAQLEEQLAEFDTEREQLRARLRKEEAQCCRLQEQLEEMRKELGAGGRRIGQEEVEGRNETEEGRNEEEGKEQEGGRGRQRKVLSRQGQIWEPPVSPPLRLNGLHSPQGVQNLEVERLAQEQNTELPPGPAPASPTASDPASTPVLSSLLISTPCSTSTLVTASTTVSIPTSVSTLPPACKAASTPAPVSTPSSAQLSQSNTVPSLTSSPSLSLNPSLSPNPNLSPSPSLSPNSSLSPSSNPNLSPKPNPTLNPSVNPNPNPSLSPNPNPSSKPDPNSSLNPSLSPNPNPSLSSNPNPSSKPDPNPSLSPSPNPSLSPNLSPSYQSSYQAGIHQRFHAARHKFEGQADPESPAPQGTHPTGDAPLSPGLLMEASPIRQLARSTVTQVLSRFTTQQGASKPPPSNSSPFGTDYRHLAPSSPITTRASGASPLGLRSPTIPRADRGNPPPIPPKKPGLAQSPASPGPSPRAAHVAELSASCALTSSQDGVKELDRVVSSTS